MKAVNKGFTLIELMIVVAIVAILAAIALPAYQSYTEKARMTELMQASSPIKSALEIYAFEKGNFKDAAVGTNGLPSTASIAEGPNTSGYSIEVAKGDKGVTITMVGDKDLDGHSFLLYGERSDSGNIAWSKKCTATGTKTALCVADSSFPKAE
ncbi:MAG: prepilin-type N-terminal cleavage/methylation domain-containing protein [Plesiomonas shigelloides]